MAYQSFWQELINDKVFLSIASTLLVNIVIAFLYIFVFYCIKKGCDKTSQDRFNDKELEREKNGLL